MRIIWAGFRSTVVAALVSVLVTAAAFAPAPPAEAQTPRDRTGARLQPSDVEPGRCLPDRVDLGHLTTCHFPIAESGMGLDFSPSGGPYVAFIESGGTRRTSQPCRVEDGLVVCPALPGGTQPGSYPVRVGFGAGAATGPVATIEVGEFPEHVLSIRPVPRVAFAGLASPLPIDVRFGFDAGAGVMLTVHDPVTDAVLEVLPIAGPGEGIPVISDPDTGDEVTGAHVTITAEGPVNLGYCLAAAAETCRPLDYRYPIEVLPTRLVELVPDHNVPGADRIDVVIVGVGYPDVAAVIDVARPLVAADGRPRYVLGAGAVTAEPTPQALSVEFGPFAIAPLRDLVDRFNLWVLDTVTDDPTVFSGPIGSRLAAVTDASDVAVTVLASVRRSEVIQDNAEASSFERDPEPSRDTLRFGTVFVYPDPELPALAADVLAHEWGHSLFGLLDEYVDRTGRFTLRLGYPNCASSQEEAESWWGDLVGEVDPFADEVRAAVAAGGDPYPVPADDDFTIGYFTGGCYSSAPVAVRPTADSIMNSGIPVFGAVNARRVEQIAGMFTGRRLLAAVPPDFVDLTGLRCGDTEALVGELVSCDGTLPPYVGVADGMAMALGGPAVTCDVAEASSPQEALPFRCEDVPVGPGVGDLAVRLDLGSGLETTSLVVRARPRPEPLVALDLDGRDVTIDFGEVPAGVGAPALLVTWLPDAEQRLFPPDAVPVVAIAPGMASRVCVDLVDGDVPLGGAGRCADLPVPPPAATSTTSSTSPAAAPAAPDEPGAVGGAVPWLAAAVVVGALVGLALVGGRLRRRRR